jgi:hypothetical protein
MDDLQFLWPHLVNNTLSQDVSEEHSFINNQRVLIMNGPKIKYHQRNGSGCYSLNGEPLSIEDEQHYQVEMRRARELYHHHKEVVEKLPGWVKKAGKRFNIKAITLYL